MFCSFLDFRLKKTIKLMFLLSTLLFVLGVQVCFGQPAQITYKVIDNDLYVTQTLRAGIDPNARVGSSPSPELNLIVNGMTASGHLTIGPWPADSPHYVFFGANTLSQSEKNNYALLQRSSGSERGRTYLNSPIDIRFRINNKDKMILSNSGKLQIRNGIESIEGSSSDLKIYDESKGDVTLVRGGGNVGIGGPPGNYKKLEVYGNSHLHGRIKTNGTVFANGFQTNSDANLKTNIAPLAGALEKLEQIRGVSFEWNDKSESKGYSVGQKSIGVIAQEVEAVFPELVFTSEDDGYKAVEYSRLTSVLIEAVKELKAKNEVLEQKVEALEKCSSMDGK